MEIRKNLRCADCFKSYEADLMAEHVVCPHCGHRLPRIDQLGVLLDEWYYPRRWYKAVDRPRPRFLIERLWQQQLEPNTLYTHLAPPNTNFEVFVHDVTSVIVRGIEEGWVKLEFPPDPLADDPIYKLQILDMEYFSNEMEKAMPNIQWDEEVEVQDLGAPQAEEQPPADHS